MLVLYMNKTTL